MSTTMGVKPINSLIVESKPTNSAKMALPDIEEAMNVKPVDNVKFGILKGVKKRPYGDYLWGEYKDYKIEVYDAYKYNQLLIYVSKNMNFVKSKLIYLLDGIKKVTRAEGRTNDRVV